MFENVKLIYIVPPLLLFCILVFLQLRRKRYAKEFGVVKTRLSLPVIPILGMLCLVIFIWEPVLKLKAPVYKERDIVFVVDISRSMLAEDIQPNRLSATKKELIASLKSLTDSRLGIVIFAGESIEFLPLTTDKQIFIAYANELRHGLISNEGSNIPSALEVATKMLKEDRTKILVLLTDGGKESGLDQNLPKIMEITRDMKKNGITLVVIGIGGEKPAPIPVYNEKGQKEDFLRSKKTNKILKTSLDERLLKELAAHGGEYYRYKEVGQLVSILKISGKKEVVGYKTKHVDIGFVFLLAALVFLTIFR